MINLPFSKLRIEFVKHNKFTGGPSQFQIIIIETLVITRNIEASIFDSKLNVPVAKFVN